jgi:hypothetical protein
MTNTLAIWLGVIVLGLLAADLIMADGGGSLFLARKGLDLIEWLAFWR